MTSDDKRQARWATWPSDGKQNQHKFRQHLRDNKSADSLSKLFTSFSFKFNCAAFIETCSNILVPSERKFKRYFLDFWGFDKNFGHEKVLSLKKCQVNNFKWFFLKFYLGKGCFSRFENFRYKPWLFRIPSSRKYFLSRQLARKSRRPFSKNLNTKTCRLSTLFRKQASLDVIHPWDGESERESVSHDWTLRKMIH